MSRSTRVKYALACIIKYLHVSVASATIISEKGKAIPLQAWIGPVGFSSLRLPDFKTTGT